MKFVLRRLLESVLSLWFIATLTFFSLRALPGGPFDFESALPNFVQQQLKTHYGLNQPIWAQYKLYIFHLLQGDLGESLRFAGRPVTTILLQALPNSMLLGILAFILSWMLAIPLALTSAQHAHRWIDQILVGCSLLIISLPTFVIAPLLILLFSFQLDWLPAALWQGPKFMILPVIALSLRPSALMFRLLRTSSLEIIRSDYVRTARAKGLSISRILYHHVLRNSILPMLTMSGPILAEFLAGSFMIELIFSIPGMGEHFVYGIFARDYSLIVAAVLIYATFLIICNWIVDVAYHWIDPRIEVW